MSEQRNHFDRLAKQQAVNEYFFPDRSPFVSRQNQIFFNFANLQCFAGKILEVGCGTGELTLALLRHKFKVSVLDISKESLLLLKKYIAAAHLNSYLERVICGSLEDYAEELNGQFDCVISASFIHHTVDINRTIYIIRNILKPGGKLLAREPNGSWPLWYYLPIIIPSFVWEYEKGLLQCTQSNWLKLLSKAGFGDIYIEPLAFLPARFVNYLPSLSLTQSKFCYRGRFPGH